MLSQPPATMTEASPTSTWFAAVTMACRPEPHKRLTFIAVELAGMPAASAQRRALYASGPTCPTWPITTSSTSSATTPARSSAAEIATPPRALASTSFNAPPKRPTGVPSSSNDDDRIIGHDARPPSTIRAVLVKYDTSSDATPDADTHLLTLLLNMLNWTIFWYRPDGHAFARRKIAQATVKTFLDGWACATDPQSDGGV